MKKYFLLLTSFLLLSIFFGCSATQSIEEEQSISAERIVKRIEANRRKTKSFVGTGTVTVNTSDLNTKSSFRVEVKKPDSLKVSFYGPFSIDLASALITTKDFLFFDMINNKCYKGKIRPGIIKDVMKVNIPYEELIDAVTGSVNLTDKLRLEPIASKLDDNKYELLYPDSTNNILNKIIIDIETMRIVQFIISDLKGKISYQADYENFRKVDEVYLPFVININDKSNNQKLKIEYRKIEINQLNEKLKIDVPEDAEISEI